MNGRFGYIMLAAAGLLFLPIQSSYAAPTVGVPVKSVAGQNEKISKPAPQIEKKLIKRADVAAVVEKPAVSKEGLSLEDVLQATYQSNPQILAARAELKATQELYPQARAGFLPTVSGSSVYSSSHNKGKGTQTSSDPKSINLEVTQPVYHGGSTLANFEQAKSLIKAGEAKLTAAEESVLLSAVTAYTNVMRDQEIVSLQKNNEKVLQNHLSAAKERFKVGDITKTDVSQAEARLAAAVATRDAAEGNLSKSNAEFERITGMKPTKLQRLSALPALPASVEDALTAAASNNPSLIMAKNQAVAADAGVRSVEGTRLPQVDLSGGLSRTYDPAVGTGNYEDTSSVAVRATIPLYAGGAIVSKVRQSQQVKTQREREVDDAERSVRSAVVAAWEDLSAVNAEIKSLVAQIEAEKLALEGVKVESEYGSRTTLDLLDAEYEYHNAQVTKVTAERNRTVAAFSLLSAMGQLTGEHLHLQKN